VPLLARIEELRISPPQRSHHWLEALLDVAKLLLAADESTLPTVLLRRVIEATGAERGAILVKEDGRFVPTLQVQAGSGRSARRQLRFSERLVEQALASPAGVHCPGAGPDTVRPSEACLESPAGCCVLVAPLRVGAVTYGALYLEHGGQYCASSAGAMSFLAEFGELAGLCIRRHLERQELLRRGRELERDLFARCAFEGIVTADAAMLELLLTVAQVAESDVPVLVHGETGTGKELVARAVHLNSARRKGPFVVLNCAALPASVLESELFGHARGAFTGAQGERKGRIAMAEGGTLFLDEVAEMPLELQAKLLRFLQFGELQRVGSDRTETVDVRVVAATHQDLSTRVEAQSFRKDLYFRLAVVELRLPPLRERQGDIPLLLDHFLRLFWRGEAPPRFSAEAEQALLRYAYPGNVRELANIVRRACVLARAPVLDAELLPGGVTASAAPGPGFAELTNDELKRVREAAAEEVERRFVRALLKRHGGNVSQAAREAGINRSQLHKMLERCR
jgi:transcriptional regulator with GAF, ATPase, and Fis domain